MLGACSVRHPEDVAKLKRELADLVGGLDDHRVQGLYSDWCEYSSAAGWLDPDEVSIECFRRYLEDDV